MEREAKCVCVCEGMDTIIQYDTQAIYHICQGHATKGRVSKHLPLTTQKELSSGFVKEI